MATTADFRNGLCLDWNGDLYTITDFQHVKPGKGPAFVRTKLRNIKTGRVIDNTFNAGVTVVTARIEKENINFFIKMNRAITSWKTKLSSNLILTKS